MQLKAILYIFILLELGNGKQVGVHWLASMWISHNKKTEATDLFGIEVSKQIMSWCLDSKVTSSNPFADDQISATPLLKIMCDSVSLAVELKKRCRKAAEVDNKFHKLSDRTTWLVFRKFIPARCICLVMVPVGDSYTWLRFRDKMSECESSPVAVRDFWSGYLSCCSAHESLDGCAVLHAHWRPITRAITFAESSVDAI